MEISMFITLVVTVFFVAHGSFLGLVTPTVIKSIFKYNAKYALKNNVEVTITWREPLWLIMYFLILLIPTIYIYVSGDFKSWVIYVTGTVSAFELIVLFMYITYFCFFREE